PRFLAALLVSCLAAGLINIGVVGMLFPMQTPGVDLSVKLMQQMFDFGLFLAPWLLIYYFYHYINKIRKQEIDTLKLEALVKALELKTIKSHINPHFIFNALNSIRALIDENP